MTSMYEPYYNKIQELLFDGMDLDEVNLYINIFFGINGNKASLKLFIVSRKLDWFMEQEWNDKQRRIFELTTTIGKYVRYHRRVPDVNDICDVYNTVWI